MSEFRVVNFANGLTLHFCDRSNRYFGDYHQVLIEVEARVTREAETLRLAYQRPLRRMAVPGAAVEECRAELVEQFLSTTADYLQRADFVPRLLATLARPGQKLWRPLD